jgi:hypothetical protein
VLLRYVVVHLYTVTQCGHNVIAPLLGIGAQSCCAVVARLLHSCAAIGCNSAKCGHSASLMLTYCVVVLMLYYTVPRY